MAADGRDSRCRQYSGKKALLRKRLSPSDVLMLTCNVEFSEQVSAQEITSLVKGFDDPSPLQAGGIHVNSKKYFALQADNRSIYGKASVRRARWTS